MNKVDFNRVGFKHVTLITGVTVILSLSSQAAVIFIENFDNTAFASSGTEAHIFGGESPDIQVGEWFGSTNGVSIASGDLSLGNTAVNRYRGAGIWLDASGWTAGTITVAVDVANFPVTPNSNSNPVFQVFTANGVDSMNSVSLDLHGGFNSQGNPTATGSASINQLGVNQEITGNGTAVTFSFDYNGTDQFVGLVFANSTPGSATGVNTVDLDNLTVSTIPEPSSAAFISLAGLIVILYRRT